MLPYLKVRSVGNLIGAIATICLLVFYSFHSPDDLSPPCIDLGSGMGASRYHCFHEEPVTFIVGFLVFIGIAIYFFISAFEIKKGQYK